MAMLKELHLISFKGFKDFTLKCSPFTVLVGKNNSGKTSVLQAIQLLHEFLQFALGGGERPDFTSKHWKSTPSRPFSRSGFIDLDAIWLDKRTTEPCRISAEYSNGLRLFLEIQGKSSFTLDPKKGDTSLLGTLQEEANQKLVDDVFRQRPIYIPPTGAISGTEQHLNYEEFQQRQYQGRFPEVWRNWLWWLCNDEKKTDFAQVVAMVQRYCPDVRILTPKLTHDGPPRVEIDYHEHGPEFDIAASGGGLRTLLNMAVVLQYSCSRCLLFDEPDAHLHSSLQRDIARMLTDYGYENEAQVFVATHAPDFITAVPTASLVWVDRKETKAVACSKLGQTLVDLGAIDNSDAIRVMGADKVLFVEGGLDRDVLTKFFDLLGSDNPLKCGTVLLAELPNGKGDRKYLQVLQDCLREVMKIPVKIACILDNDYELQTSVTVSSTSAGEPLVVKLQRKEIENYFLDPALLATTLGKKGCAASADEITKEIERITDVPEICNCLRYQYLPRYRDTLPTAHDDATKEQEADTAFKNRWSDLNWRFRNCPGKQVWKKLHHALQEKYKHTLTADTVLQRHTKCPDDIRKAAEAIAEYFAA